MYWWTRPSLATLLIVLPIFLFCALLPESSYILYAQNGKYFSGEPLLLAIAALGLFSLGAALTEGGTHTSHVPVYPAPLLNKIIATLFGLVVTAYVIFFSPLLDNWGLVVDHLNGSITAQFMLREVLNRIPGITSFVSLQSLVLILVLQYPLLSGKPVPRWQYWVVLIVALLAALRTWLWSERLALLELLLPLAFVRFGEIRQGASGLVALAPLYGAVAVFGLFCVSEYFRSWQSDQQYTADSFPTYVGERFLAYYATALNNGAALLLYEKPFYAPVFTAEWFHKLPIWALLDPDSGGPAALQILDLLDIYGTREFNNLSGIFMPLLDYGVVLGLAVWLILGLAAGTLYHAYRRRTVASLILFPAVYIGIAEIPRVFYWGLSRFFPVLVAAIVIAILLAHSPQQRPNTAKAEP